MWYSDPIPRTLPAERRSFMAPVLHQRSKSIALSGLMAALSVVILLLCGLIPLATFACPILAMLCQIPVLRECGRKLTLAMYAAVSLLALLLVPDKELAFFYLFLGYYPAVRPLLNRVSSRALRLAAKCGLFLCAMTAMYLSILKLFKLEVVVEEFAGYSHAMLVALVALGMVTFLLFDLALHRFTLLYEYKLRSLLRKK